MQDEYKIPVIIGSGRTTKSPFGPLSAAGGFTPAGLIGEALELAVADAGAGDEIYQSIDAWGSPQFTTGGETNNVPWLVAKKYGLTREDADAFALRSHTLAAEAAAPPSNHALLPPLLL